MASRPAVISRLVKTAGSGPAGELRERGGAERRAACRNECGGSGPRDRELDESEPGLVEQPLRGLAEAGGLPAREALDLLPPGA